MWKWLNEMLSGFRYCFSRESSYSWFVIMLVGLMIRTDHVGITGIVRELSLQSSAYVALLHFFRAESWYVGQIQSTWLRILKGLPILFKVDGRPVMVGDGVKQSKEGRFMPGVKRLHQESENSAKGEYIFGHMFGGLGLLLGSVTSKLYCLLISLRLHDGLSAINGWNKGESYEEESHVVKMIKDAANAAFILGSSILLLDRLFLTVPMLATLAECPLLQVVTKAKSNVVAYRDPKPKTGRGAKPKKGEKVQLNSLFQTHASQFITDTAILYGKVQQVKYYCVDLLWGQKLYQKLRFVLVVVDGKEAILVSTDLTLQPLQIISLYCYRFKIECSFRELKQVVAGFCYRFWSKSMPKLNKYSKNEENQEKLKAVSSDSARSKIKSCAAAIDRYALLSCIALGLLQIISLLFADTFTGKSVRFMRTKSKAIPSEATIADFMRKNIYQLFRFFPDLPITRIINAGQSEPFDRPVDSA